MKNLIIDDLDNFISIADSFPTPLKIFRVESVNKNKVKVEANCFLRTFMISHEEVVETSKLQEIRDKLEQAGFVKGRIEETKVEIEV